ncbi:mucin-2-like [Haliotis rufescens]|uniref:mucin-2-like n=1 Tax=Haliotis rufescens TaxID=6454 RepID=UPI00201F51F9|nr:mucin-2-like [Haliotis rufescens]
MSDIVKLMFIVLVMLNSASTAGSSLCVDEVFDLIFRDKSATDYVVSGKAVPSRAECSVLCHQEEGCVSMAYSGSGECVLHGQLPQTLTVVSNQDTDIYYRQGAVPHSTNSASASATTSPMIVTTTARPTTPTTNATPLTTFEEPSPSSTVNAATPLTAPVGSTTTPAASTMTSPMTIASTVTVTTTRATSTSTSTTATTTTTTPTTTTTSTITTTPTTITSLTTTTTTTASTTTTTATPSTTTTISTSTTTSTTRTTPTTITWLTTTTASSSTTTTTTTPSTTTTTSTTTTSTTTTTPTTSLTTTTAATSQLVVLWVTAVLAYSSEENTEGSNAASQVIGESDVYPDHGHNVKAWGQSDINNDHQYVELKYAMKLFISEVHVYETHRAGATWLVEILTPSGEYVTMYRAKRLYRLSSSRIVELVLIHLTSFTSDVIRVWVDPSYAGGSVEIDAVKLVGMTDPNQQ